MLSLSAKLHKQKSMTIKEFMGLKKIKEDAFFFVETIESEVRKLKSKKELQKVKKIMATTLYTCTTFLALVTPAWAESPLPPEIVKGLLTIQLIMLGLVGGIATICFMLAGAMRIFNMGTKAKTWTREIIWGLLQVLIAPLCIWLIISIVKSLLRPVSAISQFY